MKAPPCWLIAIMLIIALPITFVTYGALEYLKTHDGDITYSEVCREFPNINKNSIYSAFTTLESRGLLRRMGKINGKLVWRKPQVNPVDRALYQFCRNTAMIGG